MPIINMIQSPRERLNENATMIDLIDPNCPNWKDELLQSLFFVEEAKMIKSIPLSLLDRDDKLVWKVIPNGFFSIKSAYYLNRELIT